MRSARRLATAIPPADPSVICDFNVGPGFKFGLGLLLNTEPAPGARAAMSGTWAGIFNSHFWIDRTTGLTGAIYTQTLPSPILGSSACTRASRPHCTRTR